MKEQFARALVDAPGHLIGYVVGLIIAILGDYSLITLTIFAVLLGFALHSVLIAATAFFGLYFLLRLVANLGEGIGFHASRVEASGYQQAQATMQVAAALAQFHPPETRPMPPPLEDDPDRAI